MIVVAHQNFLVHNPNFKYGYTIKNNDELLKLFHEYDVRLGLSGHLHIQKYTKKDDFYDIITSALSVHTHPYGMIHLQPGGKMTYETRSLQLDLPEDSIKHFWNTTYQQVINYLNQVEMDENQKQQMASFAADVNLHYFIGDLNLYKEEYLKRPAYLYWKEFTFENVDDFFGGYIMDALVNNKGNQQHLEIDLR